MIGLSADFRVLLYWGDVMTKKNTEKGFTLAELLIVVAIIGVLVAISIPIFTKQVEKAKEAADWTTLYNIYETVSLDVLEGDINRDTAYAMWYYKGKRPDFSRWSPPQNLQEVMKNAKFKSKALSQVGGADPSIKIKIINGVPYVAVLGGGSGRPYTAMDGTPFTLPKGNKVDWTK